MQFPVDCVCEYAHTAFARMEMHLRTARKQRGLTQTELSERSGVSAATISRLEAGEISDPSNSTAARLELALKLRRGTLVFGQVMEKAS